ncbi:MAG: DUF5361 domain-containing protein [Acetivibrionales bacterium]|jgi:hypothetical protein
MIREDEDALICDFAETYNIYNYKAFPLTLAATLASGLREDSRIKKRLAKAKVSVDTLLMAAAVDRLSLLVWAQTKDATKGRNRPKPIMDFLFEKESDLDLFESGKEFEEQRNKLLQEILERR